MTFMPYSSTTAEESSRGDSREPFYRRHTLPIVGFFLLMAFLAAPFPFDHKAHVLMHGLCAQTPSHSFYFDGRALPFDSRMTGIYSGFLSTVVILIAAGRHRRAGLPSIGAGLVLAIFVVSMGIDGFNSLLRDLGMTHLYTPRNDVRLVTGWMAGIGIACVVCMLIGMTLWRSPKMSERVVSSPLAPFVFLIPVLPVGLLIATHFLPVYYAFSILLMASAILAVSALVMVTLLMLANRENRAERFDELRNPATLSLILAVLIILAIGGGRFWLESVTHAPPLV